jgi:DNA-binding response OmpR family regulator
MLARVQKFSCPCCGSDIGEAASLDAVAEAVSSPTRNTILEMLARNIGRPVRRDTMIDRLYGDRPDGGPDAASSILMVQVSRLRREIEPFGWTVSNGKGGAGDRAQWRLIPLEKGP